VKPTVLIVDDSLTVRMDLQEAFEAGGFATTACEVLANARSALAQQTFSLVVLDVMLPDGDGIDLLREIKGTPGTAATPVILLSTEAEVRERVRGLKTGADDYVGKPYDAAHVVGRARQLVGNLTPDDGAQAGRSVLLIDDSATFRNAFQSVLENAGYRVVTAETGEEGLHVAVAIRPLAVIVDGQLPGGMDGATVIRRLKQDVTLRDTPCLLLTASETPGDELRTLDAGADAYVRKDENVDVVLARIAALLRTGRQPVVVDPRGSTLLGPKKILAVDDSATYLHELADELREEGYDVILAGSGKEALELLEVQSVDCILLDLLMPNLSGKETCQIIKKRAAWRQIPLVILTAVEEAQALVEGINAGADDYVPKSGDFEVLKARVRAQLRRKQFEDENQSIHKKLLEKELEVAQAKASQEIAETRASLTDELQRKNQELETFTYSVSHDLRAPVRALHGFSQMLLEDFAGQLPPKAQEYVSKIREAAIRMGNLVEALLQLSRLDRARLNCELVDFSQLVRAIAGELQQSEPERQVDFLIKDGLVIEADRHLIRAALDNLMGNAWKFTRKEPHARIEVGASPMQPVMAYFVRDNGAGFNLAYADKLFAPFQRMHKEADFPGTGIGLATVRRIVERHGGRVWAESKVGQGATFWFTLGSSSTPSEERKQTSPAAANALGCDLVYALVPKGETLRELVEERARAQAKTQVLSVEHSMALEDQAVGRVDEAVETETERRLRKRGIE
jgi:two-component system, NtrC family, sensor kinase